MCDLTSCWVSMYAIVVFFLILLRSNAASLLEFCFRYCPGFFVVLISSDLGMGGLSILFFLSSYCLFHCIIHYSVCLLIVPFA